MDLGLAEKKVVITGGSRGIGFAAAESFLAEGAYVAITGRGESVEAAVRTLEKGHRGRISGLQVDFENGLGVPELVARLEATDVIVNNAGAIPGGGLESVDDASWRRSWDVKLHAYIDVARQALPLMMERGKGVIVNVIGIAGADPRYDYVCGSAANAALIAFTKAVGGHSTSRGVRVVGLNPGPTQTDRLMSLYKSRARERFGDENRWQEMLSHLPFGRPARPQEMADLIVFLSSERASYLSGVVIDADGGGMYASS